MVSLAPLRRARRTARSKAGCTEAVASISTRMLLNGSIRSSFLWLRSREMRDTHDVLGQDERNATPDVVQFRRPSAELAARAGTTRHRTWTVGSSEGLGHNLPVGRTRAGRRWIRSYSTQFECPEPSPAHQCDRRR